MTNVTLFMEELVYKGMKKHTDVKWSEFIRRKIKERVEDLDKLDKSDRKESILNMLASEDVLKKDWDNEEDEVWNDL